LWWAVKNSYVILENRRENYEDIERLTLIAVEISAHHGVSFLCSVVF